MDESKTSWKTSCYCKYIYKRTILFLRIKKKWDVKNKSVEFINPVEFLLKTL